MHSLSGFFRASVKLKKYSPLICVAVKDVAVKLCL